MSFERPTGPLNPTPNVTPDVQSAVAPLQAAESSAQAAAAKVSAEAAALSGKALAAVGNAALAAIPAAGEPISPIIQLIMKMPGAMGLVNNFFEILQNLFSGENLMKLFDPLLFQHALGSQAAMLHHLAAGAEHFTVSLAHMPVDGMMKGLQNTAGSMGHMDLSKVASASAEHFTQNPANVGAQTDLANAQFEGGAGHVTSGHEGAVAGPAVTHGANADHLAGNTRLFSDKIGSGGNFSSVTSATNVPSTSNAIPNSSGATFGQEASGMPAVKAEAAVSGPAVSDSGAGSQLASHASPALESAGSSVIDKFGGSNVVAQDVGTYRPTMGNYWSPNQNATAGGGSDFIEPMKAKQLTYSDLQSQAPSAKSVVDRIGHQTKGFGGTGSSRMMDGIGHQTLPKAYSSAPSFAGSHHVTPAHHVSHAQPHVSHHTVHHTAPKHVDAAPAAQDQSQIAQGGDQGQIGQPTDQAVAGSDTPSTYTVQKGDSLWNIAQKQFGDGTKWTEIYKMNSDVIGQNPDLIFSGTELKLPGSVGGMDQAVADAGKYVVKPGDNLWDIARKQLGDGTKWGDLYKANAGVIGDNPRLILPGQELSMPGANEALASASPANAMPAASAMPQGVQPQQMGVAMNQQAPVGMDAMQQPVAQQPMMQQQPIMEQAPVQMQQMQTQNYSGAAYAGEGVQPAAAQQVIQVQPRANLPVGPGAAGAAEIPANPADAVVSSALAPDLSWIKKQ